MTQKLSERTYKTETVFRREIERRLRTAVSDTLWKESGQSVWRDADIERGYAVQVELDFALRSLRRRRTTGELPAADVMHKEPRQQHLWRLRSRVLAHDAMNVAHEWREQYLEPTGTTRNDAEPLIPTEPGKFRKWLVSLVRTDRGSFLGKQLVRRAPNPRVSRRSTLSLGFPSAERPRLADDSKVPDHWWTGAELEDKELIEVDAWLPGKAVLALEPNAFGRNILRSIPRIARRLPAQWSLAEVTGFLLFGAMPLLGPLQARVHRHWGDRGVSAEVTLRVDPRISAEEVAAFYREIVRDPDLRLKPATKVKGLSDRVMTLVEFLLARTGSAGPPAWSSLWREWQSQYGRTKGWSYSSPNDLAKVAKRAVDKLKREAGLPP